MKAEVNAAVARGEGEAIENDNPKAQTQPEPSAEGSPQAASYGFISVMAWFLLGLSASVWATAYILKLPFSLIGAAGSILSIAGGIAFTRRMRKVDVLAGRLAWRCGGMRRRLEETPGAACQSFSHGRSRVD